MITRMCKTCEWFDASDNEVTGRCRTDPPRFHEGGSIGFWPQVRAIDWCGAWEARGTMDDEYDLSELTPGEPDDAGEADAVDGQNAELEQGRASESSPGERDRAENSDQRNEPAG